MAAPRRPSSTGTCRPTSTKGCERDGSVDPDALFLVRHSAAHVMAEALEALYPGTKFGIGPPIENGFYYDVDFGDRLVGADAQLFK